MFRSNKLMLFAATLFAAAAFTGCCDKEEAPTDGGGAGADTSIVLPNGDKWVMFGDDVTASGSVVDLNSAIYNIEDDGTYTFYFTEDYDVTTVDGMLAAGDLLVLSGVANPAGKQTDATLNYNGSGRNISAADFSNREISIDLLYNSNVKLWVELTNGAGENFRACYNGQCLETGYPELGGNAVAVNKETPVTLGSVVEVRNEKTGIWTYYLYEEEGVETADADAAIFTLTVPKALVDGVVEYGEEEEAPSFEQDFYNGLAEGTDITFDAMPADYAHHAHGTLYAGILDDAAGPYQRDIRMEYSSDDDDVVVRLNWQGTVWATYDSENSYTITFGDKDNDYEFDNVFTTTDGVATYYMFGTNGADKCEDLKAEGEAEFGVKWSFANLSEGAYTELDALASWNLYNYATLDTHVNGKRNTVVSGSFQYAPCPNAEGEEAYLLFDLLYSTGQRVKGEWYGPLTETTMENAEIAPFKPVYYMTFTNSTGEELKKLEITEVYHEMWAWFPEAGYKSTTADSFHFMNEEVEKFDRYGYLTPQIAFHPNYIDGETYDLSYEYASKNDWYQPFSLQHYSPTDKERWAYGSSFPSSGWTSGMQTTAAGEMRVSKDDTGVWHIYIKLQDLIYNYRGVGYPYGSHTDNFMIIEYHGSVIEL